MLFDDPTDVGSLFSGSSAFSEHLEVLGSLLKPCLENFEHYFASV